MRITYCDRKEIVFGTRPHDDPLAVISGALSEHATKKKFVSRANFDSIVTPEMILQVVMQPRLFPGKNNHEKLEIAQNIYYGRADRRLGPCRKLVAVMALVDREPMEEVIEDYMKDGICDDCLPFKFNNETQSLVCRTHGIHSSINRPRRNRALFCHEFTERSQWVMTPFITWEEQTGIHNHYVMDEGGPLPVVFEDSVSTTEGGFGVVYKVRIEPEDGQFSCYSPGNKPGVYALKQLKHDVRKGTVSTCEADFDYEVGLLIFAQRRARSQATKVQQLENIEINSHMIQLLASFEIADPNHSRKDYFMLFPWADGSLSDFWTDQRHSPMITGHIGWMIYQFAGLVKALQCIHNNSNQPNPGAPSTVHFGRHGDIKPSNILYFDHHNGWGIGGVNKTLSLADFGLGRLHKRHSRSKDSPSEHAQTATYRAPESELLGGKLSPKSDVFSLGCVFLEHVTWLILSTSGGDPIDEFSNQRSEKDIFGFESDTFYRIVDPTTRGSAKLKESVQNWIGQTLKRNQGCVEVIYDLLELIEKKMLEPMQDKRIDSRNLGAELLKIVQRWQQDGEGDYGKRHWTLCKSQALVQLVAKKY
ncbi:kinase-like domain-containing protein [Podospora fimiseda]|uniref:Kinase-like domain-containing protein n=1 Tax=Podospora fimiseda TaxID=252190 RepID=A0AAN6YQY3_9PEZI|nr:kinase-like domain-containing protein [Podospora fimiseda]